MALAWLPATLWRFSPWAAPGAILVVAVLAGILALVGWAGHAGVRRVGAPVWFVLPVVWTAGEWLRAHAPGTLAFPWLELGVSLAAVPEWAGVAELVGARGVGFWMALIGGLVAAAWPPGTMAAPGGSGRRARVRAAPAVAALLVALLPGLWGVGRAMTLETRPATRVAVVQPDIPVELRREDPEAAWAATRSAVEGLLARIDGAGVELVVLPEVVLQGVVVPGAGPTPATRPLARIAAGAEAPVLFGAFGETEGIRYNSAFLWSSGAAEPWRYDKRRLVPMVERVPLRLPAWLGLSQDGEYGVGAAAEPRAVAGTRLGVLICYESLFADLARAYRRDGAEILVNLTNDAWFGGEPWWARTPAFFQHPAHLVLRAIETRTGAVRAANTGISLVVEPTGRTRHRTGLFEPSVFTATVRTTDVRTLYVRTGDWVGPASALALLAFVLTGLGARRGRAW